MAAVAAVPTGWLLLMLPPLLMTALDTCVLGEVMKGISYGPMPLKAMGQYIPLDDFMSEPAKPMWGSSGRGDLKIMKQLGANLVRLYGNDPRQSHTGFFDEARTLGLGVIPGLSDWPYMQMQGSCAQTGYVCYDQVRESYAGNLRNGWLLEDKSYHPALQQVIVINEPDLKLPGLHDPTAFSRAVISAVDGMLAAEAEAQVTGVRVNFTATFSFGICDSCRHSAKAGAKPALSQMLELRNAFLNPQDYGYTPRNDLAAFYASRFANSFNTANPSGDIPSLFLDAYEAEFPGVPVFIGEFHSPQPPRDQAADVRNMLQIAESSSLMLGISFFEWQVRYDKGGHEMNFGMFGLGEFSLGEFDFHGYTYDAWCLVPVTNSASDQSLPDSLASAYGGLGMQADVLCQTPLTDEGYQAVLSQGTGATSQFIRRVVEDEMQAVITDSAALTEFASQPPASLSDLRSALEQAVWVCTAGADVCTPDQSTTTKAEEEPDRPDDQSTTTTTEEETDTTGDGDSPAGPGDPQATVADGASQLIGWQVWGFLALAAWLRAELWG